MFKTRSCKLHSRPDRAAIAAGDKAARFMQLYDAFDIPIVSLCDTPGFMVGPEAEKTAIVRHVARMFVTGASLTVPLFGIVPRKGYGLGAQSMIGGGFHASFFTVAWPTGEFGGMGLEGYVRLGFPQGNGSDRRSGRARKILQGQGRAALRQRQGSLDRLRAGDRRSDRSRRDTALDRCWIAIDATNAAAERTQATMYRCVVMWEARMQISGMTFALLPIVLIAGPTYVTGARGCRPTTPMSADHQAILKSLSIPDWPPLAREAAVHSPTTGSESANASF
jgi:Carboxyl transferase domain